MNEDKLLVKLFENWSGEKVITLSPLPLSGSSRRYFRIAGKSKIAIGALNNDIKENKAFIYLTAHFKKFKLNVPRIYAKDIDNGAYLLEDLGDTTLYSLIEDSKNKNGAHEGIIELYKKVIDQLVRFQTSTKGLNFDKCYPRHSFDSQSIMWDLNYFKYYFLKLARINFNEQLLENDFGTFTKYLLKAGPGYFLYRDMNSRNIMVRDNEVYFIDYQGGRKGALQYDIASLLYDAKAALPQSLRDELLDYYLEQINKIRKINKKEFLEYYYSFVLIRILQALGAYGYRGYFERKDHFLKSIPFAVRNLEWLTRSKKIKAKIPYLLSLLNDIIYSPEILKYEWSDTPAGKLKIKITSFSYREKIPADLSGNGGGFVFDCRGIVNPGRYDEYKLFTGMDENVKEFLDKEETAQKFIKNAIELVDNSINTYSSRNWNNLMVNFGCTGGRHRSVYSAERLAEHLAGRPDLIVELNHTQLNVNKNFNR